MANLIDTAIELPRSLLAYEALLREPERFAEVFQEQVYGLRDEQDQSGGDRFQDPFGMACPGACESTLMNRILEVKRQDRGREASALLKLHTAHRFLELGIPALPPPLPSDGSAAKLEQLDPRRLVAGLYSQDALRLIRDHVMDLIGEWAHLVRDFPLQLSVYEAGQVYAVSALFGYALRRADARYQLEQRLAAAGTGTALGAGSPASGARRSLAAYVAAFGPEEARELATIASQEAERVLEERVQSLFGDLRAHHEELLVALQQPGASPTGARHPLPHSEEAKESLKQAIEWGTVASMRVTVSDLRRLALEGCAFGTLLGAAEAQVDSTYELTPALGHSPVVSAAGVDEGLKFSAFRIFGA